MTLCFGQSSKHHGDFSRRFHPDSTEKPLPCAAGQRNGGNCNSVPFLVDLPFLEPDMSIEIVDLPIKNGGSFHSMDIPMAIESSWIFPLKNKVDLSSSQTVTNYQRVVDISLSMEPEMWSWHVHWTDYWWKTWCKTVKRASKIQMSNLDPCHLLQVSNASIFGVPFGPAYPSKNNRLL